MKPRILLPLSLLALVPACQTYEVADLSRYSQAQGFPVTTDTPPAGAKQVNVVDAQESGFYLFGIIPVVRVSLQGCLERLVTEARRSGADGLADVRFDVDPAQMFHFSALGLPDWSARVRVSGTLWKKGPAPSTGHPLTDPTGPPR